MSTTRLHVLIGEEVAGTLERGQRGQLKFSYDDLYARSATATPLSVSMPTQLLEHSDAIVRPWLQGLLPDNDQVLDRWARQFHVSTANPFGLLATPLGEDCPGAVRFVREERLAHVIEEDGESRSSGGAETDLAVRWLSDEDVEQLLRDLLHDHTAWLGRDFTGRFSLAGAQAKTALLFHDGRWAEPAGSYATTHILKPAIEGLDEHDLNEHLCLLALRRTGIPAARSRLVRFGDVSAVVVSRYDRAGSGLRRTRIHQEDLCQALGMNPSAKYESEGGPGPADVARLLRRTHPVPQAGIALRTFLDALLWNWVIAGTDAHAKNYSLLLAGSQVRLAPLYDVASALPYDVSEHKLRLSMKFGRDYLLNPGGRPWKYIAKALQLGEAEVRHRAQQILDLAPDAYASAAGDVDVIDLDSALPDRLAQLVADRAARCRKVLDRP